MTNLEIKVRISSFEEIKSKINSTNSVHIGELTQQDTYFIVGAKRLQLREEGGTSYFIFYTRPDFDGIKISKYYTAHAPSLLKQFLKSVFSFLFGEKVVVHKVRQLFICESRQDLDRVHPGLAWTKKNMICKKIDNHF